MFRTNPKQLIERIIRNSMGFQARPRVTGERAKEASTVDGVPVKQGDYIVRLTIDGQHFCTGVNRSWRKAYGDVVTSLRSRLPAQAIGRTVQATTDKV